MRDRQMQVFHAAIDGRPSVEDIALCNIMGRSEVDDNGDINIGEFVVDGCCFFCWEISAPMCHRLCDVLGLYEVPMIVVIYGCPFEELSMPNASDDFFTDNRHVVFARNPLVWHGHIPLVTGLCRYTDIVPCST